MSSSSSALAEVEEAAGQEGFVSDYSQSAFSFDEFINLVDSSNNKSGISDGTNHFKYSAPYSESASRKDNVDNNSTTIDHIYNLDSSAILDAIRDDARIPATVWSLDVSTGAHLDHISSEFGADLGTLLGTHRRTPDFWTRAIRGFWTDQNTDRPSDEMLSSLQFQVASCGGSSAEHADLDRCTINNTYTAQVGDSSKEPIQDNGSGATIAPTNSSGTAIGSNSPSALSQETQPVAGPDLSSLMPAAVNNFAMQGGPTFLSTLPDQCDGASAPCTIQIGRPTALIDSSIAPIDAPSAPIDAPIAPIDAPTAPIGYPAPPDLPPSDPIIYTGDPGPVSDPLPVFTPSPASPIPETSTEVMTMIGFGMMFLASRGSALNSIKRGLVGAFYKITKKSLHHYSA